MLQASVTLWIAFVHTYYVSAYHAMNPNYTTGLMNLGPRSLFSLGQHFGNLEEYIRTINGGSSCRGGSIRSNDTWIDKGLHDVEAEFERCPFGTFQDGNHFEKEGSCDGEESFKALYVSKESENLDNNHGTELDSSSDDISIERLQKSHQCDPCGKSVANENVVSGACLLDMYRFSVAVAENEDWALHMLDSMGRPGPSVLELRLQWPGNPAQCGYVRAEPAKPMKWPGFGGKYFNVDMILADSSLDIRPISTTSRIAGISSLGVCLPNSCSESDATILVSRGLARLNLYPFLTPVNSEIVDLEKPQVFSTTGIVAILIICKLFILVAIATWLDTPLEHKDESRVSNSENEVKVKSDGVKSSQHTMHHHRNFIDKIKRTLLCLSLCTNAPKLFNSDHTPGTITCLHGIRFLTTIWVIIVHVEVLFGKFYGGDLLRSARNLRESWWLDLVSGNVHCVDTFFLLSGLLHSLNSARDFKKKGASGIRWSRLYLKRFLRLSPPYFLVVLLHTGLSLNLIPPSRTSSSYPPDHQACLSYWWANVLYIVNMYTIDKQCLGHTYYLAADMQFFIVSPLVLMSLYLYKTKALCFAIVVGSWLYTSVKILTHNFGISDIYASLNDSNLLHMNVLVASPFVRVGPYIVGLLLGHAMASSTMKIKSRKYAVVGWIVSVMAMLAMVFGFHGDNSGQDPSGRLFVAVFKPLSRTLWAVAVAFVVFACNSGYGGPVNKLLSWKPFLVLARFSYGIYLIHITVLNTLLAHVEQNARITTFLRLNLAVLALLVSSIAAIVLELIVGLPAMEMARLLI